MAHGEDLDRLNGGSESSVHFVLETHDVRNSKFRRQ